MESNDSKTNNMYWDDQKNSFVWVCPLTFIKFLWNEKTEQWIQDNTTEEDFLNDLDLEEDFVLDKEEDNTPYDPMGSSSESEGTKKSEQKNSDNKSTQKRGI